MQKIGMLKPVLNCLPNEDRASERGAHLGSETAIRLAKDLLETGRTIRIDRYIKLVSTA